jgi:hypothetical protein
LYEAQLLGGPNHENSGDLRFRRKVNEQYEFFCFVGFVGSTIPQGASTLMQGDKSCAIWVTVSEFFTISKFFPENSHFYNFLRGFLVFSTTCFPLLFLFNQLQFSYAYNQPPFESYTIKNVHFDSILYAL